MGSLCDGLRSKRERVSSREQALSKQVARMTGSLLSVSLSHWPPQGWYSKPLNGVVMGGEMEVKPGSNICKG